MDHIKALRHGGADALENLQWESLGEAKVKDRVED
jgi:hypothetical protein